MSPLQGELGSARGVLESPIARDKALALGHPVTRSLTPHEKHEANSQFPLLQEFPLPPLFATSRQRNKLSTKKRYGRFTACQERKKWGLLF